MLKNRKSTDDSDFIDLFGSEESRKRKKSKKLKNVIFGSVMLLSLGIGSVGGVYYNLKYADYDLNSVVYARTLEEAKTESSKLKKQKLKLLQDLEKDKKALDKSGKSSSSFEYSRKLGEYTVKKKSVDKKIAELDKKIAKVDKEIGQSKNQKVIAQANRDYAANKRDGGTKFAKEEAKKTSSAVNDANKSEIEHDSSYDSSSSKTDATSSKDSSSSKSSSSKKEKNVKTTPNYNGGTAQGVDTEDVKRQYVDDPRRGKTDSIIFLSADESTSSLMDKVSTETNASVNNQNILVYSTDGMYSFSNILYHKLSKNDKRRFMDRAVKNIKSSDLPSKVKAKALKFISDQDKVLSSSLKILNSDASEELSTGYSWFLPFTSTISTIFGFIALLITVFLTSSIVLDTLYLSIPMYRAFMDNSDDSRPKLVSAEAFEVAQEVDSSLSSGSYRSYMASYIKRRSGIFIVTCIVIMYLISGQIYEVLVWLGQLFEIIFSVGGK